MNIELHDYFIKIWCWIAWFFIKIWILGCTVDSWDMNVMIVHKDTNIELHDYYVGLHDYLIIICFYKIRLYFITIYIPRLGIVLSIYIVVPIFIGMLSISWVQILQDDINTDIRLMYDRCKIENTIHKTWDLWQHDCFTNCEHNTTRLATRLAR